MSYKLLQALEQARNEGWAIGAFNAANLETLKAIWQAADKLESPVIIESSPGEVEFFGQRNLKAIIDSYRIDHNTQIFLNLDHSQDLAAIKLATELGYDLIHFDGGELDYTQNVKLTKQAAKRAHAASILLEGEVDHITGSSTLHKEKSATIQTQGQYSDPAKLKDFYLKTSVDIVAVFIGNIHGIYADAPKLDFERLKLIKDNVKTFLSLHGGSGIKDTDLKRAISLGINKVNINSELRLAFLESIRKAVKDPKDIAAYKWMPPVIEAVQAVVEKKIKILGSAGKAKGGWRKKIIL